MNRRTCVVTGGAGFIGSELVRQLAASGDEVLVIDNLVTGRRENLNGIAGDVQLLEIDIRDVDACRPHLRRAQVVYHLACLGVRHSLHSPIENHEVNATATLNLLAVCRREAVPKFVHVSSSEVYGTARRVPMDEEHPTLPSTVYGASKLAGEGYARAFYETYRYPTVIVRPFNTYGPRSHHEGDSGEVIPKFLLRCQAGRPLVVFGDGSQTRDFSYVSDSARGIALAGTVDAAIGCTLNLGSGCEISINDLARQISEVAGRSIEIVHDDARPGDVRRLCADTGRAQALLGHEPSISLAQGLVRLRDWYRALDVSSEELLAEEVVRNWAPAGRS